MLDNRLLVRLNRNAFSKNREYQIHVEGYENVTLNDQHPTKEFILPTGKYRIMVCESNVEKNQEIILSGGQARTLRITPSASYEVFRGFLFGLALVTLIVQWLILRRIDIPLMFIPLILLILLRRKNFTDRFELTLSK